MLEWATKACQNARISPIPVNLRQQLGTKAFSLIRFPTMSKQDFVQIACKLFYPFQQNNDTSVAIISFTEKVSGKFSLFTFNETTMYERYFHYSYYL